MKNSILCILASFLLFSCTKSDDNNPTAGNVVVSDATSKSLDEGACITGNCAGTKCFKSSGSSCSKATGCVAVTGGCVRISRVDLLTHLEEYAVEHANQMLKDSIINKSQWLHSYTLAKTILLQRAASLKN
jgi:hypothetical protein